MEFKEIGKVHAYLLEYRIIETKPSSRKVNSYEREMADILNQMDYEEIDALNNFLSAQGLSLKHLDGSEMPGILRGGRIWMLVRDPNLSCSSYISSKAVTKEIALKDTESVEKTSIWFLHIWLTYLAVIYTHTGRSVSEVSGYLDSFFSKEQLINAIKEHIEEIRLIGVEGGINKQVFDTLDSEKGKDIPRRITGFLRTLEKSKLILTTEEGIYQQTLLGAFEMANNYSRSFGNIIPEDSILENIIGLGTDGAIKSNEEG